MGPLWEDATTITFADSAVTGTWRVCAAAAILEESRDPRSANLVIIRLLYLGISPSISMPSDRIVSTSGGLPADPVFQCQPIQILHDDERLVTAWLI